MSAPLTGQVAVTSSALPLSSTPVVSNAYTIKAPRTNTHPVFIGPQTVTTSTGYQLDPGDSLDYERNDQHGQPMLQCNVADFYAVGTAGDHITWLASL